MRLSRKRIHTSSRLVEGDSAQIGICDVYKENIRGGEVETQFEVETSAELTTMQSDFGEQNRK